MILPRKRLNPARLAEAVDRALGCADGAAHVKAGYEATGGALAAADAIEKLCVGGTEPVSCLNSRSLDRVERPDIRISVFCPG